MKKIFSTIGLASVLLFASCKKDSNIDPAPVPAAQKKIKQTTLDENWAFTYNPDGKVKEMSMPVGDYKMAFDYSAGKIKVSSLSQGKLNYAIEYTMTNDKATSSIATSYDAMGQPTTTYQQFYEYNAKGLLSKTIYSNGGFREYNYDASGNLTEEDYFTPQLVLAEKAEYTYGSQKDLYPQYSYLNSDEQGFIFPPKSKMLPVSEKRINVSNGMITYQGTITYVLDADGYVLQGNFHALSAGNSDYSWTSTFQ